MHRSPFAKRENTIRSCPNIGISRLFKMAGTITPQKMKKTKLFNNFYNRRETLILNEVTKDLDKIKQRNASIPNIIHSLDASHLISVINI